MLRGPRGPAVDGSGSPEEAAPQGARSTQPGAHGDPLDPRGAGSLGEGGHGASHGGGGDGAGHSSAGRSRAPVPAQVLWPHDTGEKVSEPASREELGQPTAAAPPHPPKGPAPPLRLLVAEGQTEPEWPTAARGRRQPEASHGGRLHRKPCLCRAAGLGCPPGVGTVARPRSWLLPDLPPPGQVPSPAPQPVSPLDSGVQMQSGRWVARCSHAALHHEESILTAHWFPGA